MALFGFLGKKAKPNLTPDVKYPNQEDLYATPKLRDLFSKRMNGEGLGFGDDFVSKTTNPVIAQREARFKEQDMPFLSSQLSARGVGRSGGAGLATDVVNKASLQKSRDIDEIFAQMYKLNEAQKKSDTSEAINLGSNMNAQQKGMLDNQAAASERLANATASQQINREQYDDKGYAQGLGLLMSLGSGMMGASGSGIGTPMAGGGTFAGNQPGIGATSMYGMNNIPQGFQAPAFTAPSFNAFNALGQSLGQSSYSSADNQLLRELIKRGLI